jgi:hypothetical protein
MSGRGVSMGVGAVVRGPGTGVGGGASSLHMHLQVPTQRAQLTFLVPFDIRGRFGIHQDGSSFVDSWQSSVLAPALELELAVLLLLGEPPTTVLFTLPLAAPLAAARAAPLAAISLAVISPGLCAVGSGSSVSGSSVSGGRASGAGGGGAGGGGVLRDLRALRTVLEPAAVELLPTIAVCCRPFIVGRP